MAYYIVYFDKTGKTVIDVSKYAECEYDSYIEAVKDAMLIVDSVIQHGYF